MSKYPGKNRPRAYAAYLESTNDQYIKITSNENPNGNDIPLSVFQVVQVTNYPILIRMSTLGNLRHNIIRPILSEEHLGNKPQIIICLYSLTQQIYI